MNINLEIVIVTDINMSFGNMVVFMIKWAMAAIPVIIILGIIASVIFGGLGLFGLALFN